MGSDVKRMVVVKFKDGVAVEEIIRGMEKMVAEMECLVKSFEWGEDSGSESEALTQGFTHVIQVTFKNKEDIAAYSAHPSHLEFSAKFAAAVEKLLLFHYPPHQS